MILQIFAKPLAKKNALVKYENLILHIRIAAPPEDGKANAELIRYLSQILHVPSSSFKLLQGASSRIKRLQIETLEKDSFLECISIYLPATSKQKTLF